MRIRAQAADNAAFNEEAGPFTGGQTESIFREYYAKSLYILLRKTEKIRFPSFLFPKSKKNSDHKNILRIKNIINLFCHSIMNREEAVLFSSVPADLRNLDVLDLKACILQFLNFPLQDFKVRQDMKSAFERLPDED